MTDYSKMSRSQLKVALMGGVKEKRQASAAKPERAKPDYAAMWRRAHKASADHQSGGENPTSQQKVEMWRRAIRGESNTRT